MAHKIGPEKFLTLNRPWLQSHATAGREPLNLYRDPTGRPRLMMVGWPAPKSWHRVATATPTPVRIDQRNTKPETETSA